MSVFISLHGLHAMMQIMDPSNEALDKAGPFQVVDELSPENQLRGSFKIHTQHGVINIFFTLTPERDPKVQELDITFEPKI